MDSSPSLASGRSAISMSLTRRSRTASPRNSSRSLGRIDSPVLVRVGAVGEGFDEDISILEPVAEAVLKGVQAAVVLPRIGVHARSGRRKMRQALVPPNPKELERA